MTSPLQLRGQNLRKVCCEVWGPHSHPLLSLRTVSQHSVSDERTFTLMPDITKQKYKNRVDDDAVKLHVPLTVLAYSITKCNTWTKPGSLLFIQ